MEFWIRVRVVKVVSQLVALNSSAMASFSVPQACSRAMAVAGELPTALPPAFVAFLQYNGLDASIYAVAAKLPRYVRVKPQACSEIAAIKEKLGLKLSPLTWLPNFFSLPPEAPAGLPTGKGKQLYEMDAAFGAAVVALEIQSGDHVLDLCAAPGAKLCMMAECLGDSGSLTAVNIARPHLAACRTMVQKYGLGRRTRLYLGDGTTFSFLPLTDVNKSCSAHVGGDHCHADDIPKDDDAPGHSGGSNAGAIRKSARVEATTLNGEWRSGRTRKEKRAAKRAKYLGIPHQVGEDHALELSFYGVDSGVVGMSGRCCSNLQELSEHVLSWL